MAKFATRVLLALTLLASSVAPLHPANAIVMRFKPIGFKGLAAMALVGGMFKIGSIVHQIQANRLPEQAAEHRDRADDLTKVAAILLGVGIFFLDDDGSIQSLKPVSTEVAQKLDLTVSEMTALNKQLDRANIVLEILIEQERSGISSAVIKAEYIRLTQEYKLTPETQASLSKISSYTLQQIAF